MKRLDKILRIAEQKARETEDWPGVKIFDSAEEAANYIGRTVVIIDDIPGEGGEALG